MSSVYRIYSEKKSDYTVEAKSVLSDLKIAFKDLKFNSLRIINRYDVQGISNELFEKSIPVVFSEPPVDNTYFELPKLLENQRIFAVEFLPGQFDQRADSCAQCIQFISQENKPIVRYAKLYLIDAILSDDQFKSIKSYLINAVESREATLDKYDTLNSVYEIPETVETLNGFIKMNRDDLNDFISKYSLAMDLDDILFCQDYFIKENKDPTITEIRMIDTYWSDHCRHTTFSTNIDNVFIETDYINNTYHEYLEHRLELKRSSKPVTLMDIATLAAKKLKAEGKLNDLDESEEINACSVKIDVDVNGEIQKWLLMFKNETHNHPTEIEPFGGAATCLGGAIRDPLSGRSFVYQAMRVTGSGNPLTSVKDTIPGKLPQRKITTTAAAGYSSYGNQIGLATGHVAEIYHDGYVAKRMEIGAVIGAAPIENVIRKTPQAGDVVILLGGRTGRDGCGGATGSSKSHTVESLETCGAEVQKGNAPEERKIQRLFRNKDVSQLIKRCNDFGAGGVSVAIGELADGLIINLNKVAKKYDGLDGTELAISESQERMAVVVDKNDAEKFISLADKENLESYIVAEITEEPRLKMIWNDKIIVDISRDFLNSNGAEKHTDVFVGKVSLNNNVKYKNTQEDWNNLVSNLNVCSQRGLVERFDSSIGAATVLIPFGGKRQFTPAQAMAAKIPVIGGETKTASVMAWGFNPFISEQSPYHGAMLAVIESIAKVVAAGGSADKCWLTFQEYFERTKGKKERWGKPFAALLGAYKAQLELGCGAIGGKDSMSGSFEEIDVPPTLVSFAVSVANSDKIISPEFKNAGNKIGYICPEYEENGLPNFESIKSCFKKVQTLIEDKTAISVWTTGIGGAAEGLFKMSLGNKIGCKVNISENELFNPVYGSFIIELAKESDINIIGETTAEYKIICNDITISLEETEEKWNSTLEPIFKTNIVIKDKAETIAYNAKSRISCNFKSARPRVLIPVFPGTNSEYDTAEAFRKNGAEPIDFVIRNVAEGSIEQSTVEIEKLIKQSQIIAIPGGFSAGDEPEGSAKFITAFLGNPRIKEAIHEMLYARDGLMLGICNGFQALIKLGLVPFGKIVPMTENSPTLTFNAIGRHQSRLVTTKIASNKSPWLMYTKPGDIHTIPLSHGEGRFIADSELIKKLIDNGQVATQYVDLSGQPSMDILFNPNGSVMAIEGITSEDGRILGKMGHSERIYQDLFINVPGNKDQQLFKAGVDYFK